MASFSSPCAACKHLRRKCTQECVFAPYFPPDNPSQFANVHRIFGASNISKLLNEMSATERGAAVRSLAYEAECRLKDPVYGCVGHISILQQKLKEMQSLLINAKKELATYIGPQAMLPIFQPPEFIQQQQGPSAMIPLQQGPAGMILQQQGSLGKVRQQQPSGMMIQQEHQVIMIPEDQYMDDPFAHMFVYNNMAGPAMGAQARTSHGSQLMIYEAQQSHH